MQYSKTSAISLALLFSASLQAAPGDNVNGRWSNSFAWPLIPAHIVLMPNGKVFTYGTNDKGDQGAQFSYSVWDPALGREAGSHLVLPNLQNTDIFCGAAGVLPSGDILIPGGDTRNPANNGIKDTLILDQNSQILERTGFLNFARWYPTVTTLPNGESIIVGGRDANGASIPTPEIFNNGKWRTLWGATNGAIINGDENKWFYPRNFVAPDGRIFGMSGDQMYYIDWKGQGGSELAGKIPAKTRSQTSTAVMYQPGKILQVGGTTDGDIGARASNQAITVDITGGAPKVENLPNMAMRRAWGTSTVLPNGEVLITGGSAFDNKLVDVATMAEMWNPQTRTFRNLATSPIARLYHSAAILLPDATVLVGGGGAPGPLNNLNAEVYSPPYLFDAYGNAAPRLTLGDITTKQQYGNVITTSYTGNSRLARVTFIRGGAITHSFDMGQRFMDLTFTAQNGTVSINLPTSSNSAPPGTYMIFLVDDKGVPSVSRLISLWGEEATTPTTQPAPFKVGETYSLVARFSGKCLDVAGSSNDNGARVQQWGCNNTNAQKFRIQAAGQGLYNLVNAASGKCLDVDAAGNANGTRVQQWECANAPQQTVQLLPGTEGAWQVRFQHSNKCLDVEGMSEADGQQIHQWDCYAGAGNQEWILVP